MKNIKSFDEINEGKVSARNAEKYVSKKRKTNSVYKETMMDIKAKLHPSEWKFLQKYLTKPELF
jgi:hypothetical protein